MNNDNHCHENVLASHFSTEQLPAKEKFHLWQESIAPLYDVSTTDPLNYRAEVTVYDLGELLFAPNMMSGQEFRRYRALRERDSADHFVLQLILAGGNQGRNGRRDYSVRSGDICLYDLGRNLHCSAPDTSSLTVIIPRDFSLSYFNKISNPEGLVLTRETTMGRILGNHLKTIWQLLPTMDRTEIGRVNQVLMEVISTCYTSNPENQIEEEGGFSQATQASIDAYIDQNLEMEDLTPEHLCKTFNCSRSYLYRLFQSRGGVAHSIQQRRLERSYRDLIQSSRSGSARIGEVACRWGFKSQAHFSRLFKEAYGLTPTEVATLAQTQGKHSADPTSDKDETPDLPAFRDWFLKL